MAWTLTTFGEQGPTPEEIEVSLNGGLSELDLLGDAAVREPKEMIASSTKESQLDSLATKITTCRALRSISIKKKEPFLDLIIYSY